MSGTWGGTVDAETSDVAVAGSTMRLLDTGSPGTQAGPVLVFVHGNPTSSFLWRHVVARLADDVRCVGVDLIGMGGSGKPELRYDWADHRTYLTGALDSVDTAGQPLLLVLHDWGVGLGLEYARTRPGRVAGVAFMEGHLRPLPGWESFDPAGRELFRELRDPVLGRHRIEEDNFFLEVVLPIGMHHVLTAAERHAYGAPYPTPASRHPLWAWVTQIPIAGDPPEAARVLEANYAWLLTTRTPALLLHAEPGAVIDRERVASTAEDCPALSIRSVGAGTHFLPEDQPDRIATELRTWLRHVGPAQAG